MARHNQLFFQNVSNNESSKFFKTTVELTLTTQKANACSPWTAYSVANTFFGQKTQNYEFKLKFCT